MLKNIINFLNCDLLISMGINGRTDHTIASLANYFLNLISACLSILCEKLCFQPTLYNIIGKQIQNKIKIFYVNLWFGSYCLTYDMLIIIERKLSVKDAMLKVSQLPMALIFNNPTDLYIKIKNPTVEAIISPRKKSFLLHTTVNEFRRSCEELISRLRILLKLKHEKFPN